MKDCGIDLLGEIPEHWEVKKLKYILNERNKRSISGEEPLFMVSQTHGLVLRADYHEKAEVAQSNIGGKIVHKNDLVFNKLKAHLGVFFKSDIDYKGLVSPDYAVYYSNGIIEDLKYLEYLFRHPSYIKDKQVPVLRFPEFTEEWEVKKLGEVLSFFLPILIQGLC